MSAIVEVGLAVRLLGTAIFVMGLAPQPPVRFPLPNEKAGTSMPADTDMKLSLKRILIWTALNVGAGLLQVSCVTSPPAAATGFWSCRKNQR